MPDRPEGSLCINAGSVVGLDGYATLVDYPATKGPVHDLTRSLARAPGDRDIQVDCVATGPVWTPLIPSTRDAAEVEIFGADTYWDRSARPAEITPAFVSLASDENRSVTGEVTSIVGREQAAR